MRRALVIGASGFIGSHLTTYLSGLGVEVMATTRSHRVHGADWRVCDVMNPESIHQVLRETEPTEIYYLASWTKSADVASGLGLNLVGTYNFLEVVVTLAPEARVVVPGSAAEYGAVEPEDMPIREDCPLRPLGVYGVSKVTQGVLLDRYARVHRVVAFRPRLFNVVGPGEPETTVCSQLARQVAAVRLGQRAWVEVGRLDTTRDFVSVYDTVRAIELIATKGVPGEVYNVCSGTETSIRALTEILQEVSGCSWDLRPRPDVPRADDALRQRGCFEKLHAALGWSPAVDLGQSLRELLVFWEKRLAVSADH